MITKQQIERYRPEDVNYDINGVYVGTEFFPSDNPRLLFAKTLGLFYSNILMNERYGSWFASNTVCSHSKITCGRGCVIGGIGFGYEYDDNGSLIQMPHLGNVIIGDDVTIHNNACIDRAVTGSTIIGEGTKVDNLVHVAHGCQVGRHCLIVAGAVLGGRCEVGDYTFIGMNASILQHVKIGRNCVIGAGAVITKDVPDNQIWVGNPGRYLKDTEKRRYIL